MPGFAYMIENDPWGCLAMLALGIIVVFTLECNAGKIEVFFKKVDKIKMSIFNKIKMNLGKAKVLILNKK